MVDGDSFSFHFSSPFRPPPRAEFVTAPALGRFDFGVAELLSRDRRFDGMESMRPDVVD